MTNGKTRSCGCNIACANKKRSYLYKEAELYKCDLKTIQRLHNVFNGMKNRCYNLLSKDFPMYGARNIKIYDNWLIDITNFVSWSLSNGYKDNLTIDRIDVNGNYEPNNCRWITVAEQNRNKTTTIYLYYKGEKRTLRSILTENGIKNNYRVYANRINRYNWDVEKALSTPIRTEVKKIVVEDIISEFYDHSITTVNKKVFCERHNIHITSLNRFLKLQNVIDILNQNNIIDTKKGYLIRETNNRET